MSKKSAIKPLVAAVGAAMATSLVAVPTASADANPFGMTELSSGYMVAGGMEGKCGGNKSTSEGTYGEGKNAKEGKCGEGKCGANKTEMEDKYGGDKTEMEDIYGGDKTKTESKGDGSD